MKIGILTQPLRDNYGGILQNYALQEILKRDGHDPTTIDRHIDRSSNIIKNTAKWVIRHIRSEFVSDFLSQGQKKILSQKQAQFINQHIHRVGPFYKQKEFDNYISKATFDAYIVGSDQVWRPCYSANLENFYLNFVPSIIPKIAYAASFGVDKWEYSEILTQQISPLIHRFKAVSVREKSAVKLCEEHLHTKAQWVLDPTMLLEASDYLKIIDKTPLNTSPSPYILTYLLEKLGKDSIIENIQSLTGINKIIANISHSSFKRGESLYNRRNISVEEWLSNIYRASIIITDSFHGAVFSILFNKPFIVKLNKVRGNTRLESLLTDFNLMNCLVSDDDNNIKIPSIDWDAVNTHLKYRRKESLEFLRHALSV